MGGSALIREARQRQMLTFDQANALAAFSAVSVRCADGAYSPSDDDLNAVREGFDQFESSLTMAEGAPPQVSQGEAMSTKGLRLSPLGTPRPVPLPPEPQPWWFLAFIGIVIVGALGGIGWLAWSRWGNTALPGGLAAASESYEQGKPEQARSQFEDIVRQDPKNATAHVFLSRIARESGDASAAREHAALAVQADPQSVLALREMAAVLLASRDYELARRFYARVVQAAPDDVSSQGYLGCTLLKLGRIDEGNRWIDRAGPGPWRACAAPASTARTP